MKHNLTLILSLAGLLLTAVLAAYGICMTDGGLWEVLPPAWLVLLIFLFVFLICLMNLKKAIQEGHAKIFLLLSALRRFYTELRFV